MGEVINKEQEVIAVQRGGNSVDVEQAIPACVTRAWKSVAQAGMVEA